MFAWFVRYRVGLLTFAGVMLAVIVGSVCGKVSWGHIVEVARESGEPSAMWLPVAVDGMMLSGTAMAGVDAVRGYAPRAWSMVGMWLGSALTLCFNAASAWGRGPIPIGIAMIYAVAFLVTVETLFHPSRRYLKRKHVPAAVSVAEPVVVAVDALPAPVVPVPTPALVDEPTATVEAPVAAVEVEAPAAPAARKRKRSPRHSPSRGLVGDPGELVPVFIGEPELVEVV